MLILAILSTRAAASPPLPAQVTPVGTPCEPTLVQGFSRPSAGSLRRFYDGDQVLLVGVRGDTVSISEQLMPAGPTPHVRKELILGNAGAVLDARGNLISARSVGAGTCWVVRIWGTEPVITKLQLIREAPSASPSAAGEAGRDSTRLSFHDAARTGNLARIRELIGTGASVDERDQEGNTALVHAVGHRHGAVAAALLNAGADVNAAIMPQRVTPLHIAAASDSSPTELLLQRGAAVNAQADNGVTPLQIAAARGAERNVTLLLLHGADHRITAGNRTALDLAFERWSAAPVTDRDAFRRIVARLGATAGVDTTTPLPRRLEKPPSGMGLLAPKATDFHLMLVRLGYQAGDSPSEPTMAVAVRAFRATTPQPSHDTALTKELLDDLSLAITRYGIRSRPDAPLRYIEARCRFDLRRLADGQPLVIGGCRSGIGDALREGIFETIHVVLWATPPGKRRELTLPIDGQPLISGQIDLPRLP